jgi:hypothetical protein
MEIFDYWFRWGKVHCSTYSLSNLFQLRTIPFAPLFVALYPPFQIHFAQDPNESRCPVPDQRFKWLCDLWEPASIIPAYLHITDIAGLIRGAHEGAGLGNAFLSHIQAVDGLYHVVRAFENPEVVHVEDSVVLICTSFVFLRPHEVMTGPHPRHGDDYVRALPQRCQLCGRLHCSSRS